MHCQEVFLEIGNLSSFPFSIHEIILFQENERNYARRFDLSRSNASKVYEQAKDLFLDLRKPEEIAEFFKMVNQEKNYTLLVAVAFRAALSVVIEDIKLKR